MKPIEDLLRETMGLHATTVGATLIEQAVQSRMRLHGIVHKDPYVHLLRQSSVEWQALVETVVVTETWFFRDPKAFQTLTDIAVSQWLPSSTNSHLRLLSAPCSTGEEPYSIAMTLLDAGFPASRFQIDALDISTAAIVTAKRAEYGKNSFRSKNLDFQTRHFTPKGQVHQVSPAIQKKVRFLNGNLLDEQCLRENGCYDFIFCRNLLIYFDRPTQQRILQKLRRLLAGTGVLFVSSAELPIALKNGFISIRPAVACACRPAPKEKERARKLLTGEFTESSFQKNVATPDLIQARQLTNQGRHHEASAICEAFIREFGANAEAFYLLGRARHAVGNSAQAGEFYRKALYLEPGHYETLQQWAVLEEKNGEHAHARLLAGRAGRIKKTV